MDKHSGASIGYLQLFGKYTLMVMLSVLINACAWQEVFLAPQNSISLSPDIDHDKPIPIKMFGEDLDRPYKTIGHIYIGGIGGISPKTRPLDYVGQISQDSKNVLSEAARKMGADAVISVVETGYKSMLTLGGTINGIAITYTDESETVKYANERSEFIACLLPLISANETNQSYIELDREVRQIARLRLIVLKGYYVLTPLKTSYSGDITSFQSMDDQELDKLCGHESDLFILFEPKTQSNELVTNIYSKKEKRFIIQAGNKMPAKGGAIASGFISGGLIGAAMNAVFLSNAVEVGMVRKALEPLPEISIKEGKLRKN